MVSLFGKKKPQQNADGQTVVLLDVGSGSVAAGLVRVSPNEAPRLFGEVRVSLPLLYTRNSEVLSREIEKAVHEALLQVHTTAARLRNHEKTSSLGQVGRVAVFLGAPWGMPNLSRGKADFMPPMKDFLQSEVESFAPNSIFSYHSGAEASAYALSVVRPSHRGVLLCVVGGEIVELLHVGDSGARGYATIPQGYQTLLRTLTTHGNLSSAEANSLLSLTRTNPYRYEPLEAAGRQMLQQFAGTAHELLSQGGAEEIFVLSYEPVGEWFAQTLAADDSLGKLFPKGGEVRSLQAHHIAPHLAAHALSPDLYLMLEALFVDRMATGV